MHKKNQCLIFSALYGNFPSLFCVFGENLNTNYCRFVCIDKQPEYYYLRVFKYIFVFANILINDFNI